MERNSNMLSKKYYAQRHNSGGSTGEMNTNAVGVSSFIAMRRKLGCNGCNTVKPMNDRPVASQYTFLKKFNTLRCKSEDNSTTVQKSYSSSCKNGSRNGRDICYVHKDITTAQSQGVYIAEFTTKNACLQNDPKPFIPNADVC